MIQLKIYSNLRDAFIFQLIVGLFCLLGILQGGGRMIAILALLGFRPFILSQRTVQDPAPYWRFYYCIGKISFVFTAVTLIILYVFIQLLGNLWIALGIDPRIWVLAVLPYFLVVHGMVGLIYANQFGNT